MVPKEDAVVSGNLLSPFHHQPHDLCKLTKKLEIMIYTYLLPVLICLGLMSSRLKAANQSSQGTALYEWGPVKMIGTFYPSNSFNTVADL